MRLPCVDAYAQSSPRRSQLSRLLDAVHMWLRMQGAPTESKVAERKAVVKRKLRERAVPASPMGRIFGFAQLGAGLAYGSATDAVSRVCLPPA